MLGMHYSCWLSGVLLLAMTRFGGRPSGRRGIRTVVVHPFVDAADGMVHYCRALVAQVFEPTNIRALAYSSALTVSRYSETRDGSRLLDSSMGFRCSNRPRGHRQSPRRTPNTIPKTPPIFKLH